MLAVFRRMTLGVGLAVALACALPTAGFAKGKKEATDEFAVFVVGNTLFTLYHELGHALIDKLEIPVLGREEDAVDGLAVLMMLPEDDTEDPVAEAMILSAADGYIMAYEGEDEDDLAFWGEHSLDLQRYAAVVCLVYGSDPEGWVELAELTEMPEEQQERCPGIFAQTLLSWDALLDRHYRPEGKAGGGRIKLLFKRPGKGIDPKLVSFLKESREIRDAVAYVSDMFLLPARFDVVFESCDEANAYYDPQTGNVSMCYELVAYFAELYAESEQ